MAGGKLMPQRKRLSRLQRWSIVAACSLLLYTVFGFLILPAIVRGQLEERLTGALHRETTVREVKFNPYTLEAAVNGFQVRDLDAGETFFSFAGLQVNLQAVSLFKRAIIVKSFSLSEPYGKIILNKDRSLNFSDLLPKRKKRQQEEEETGPLLFSVNNIQLTGGGIDFEDRIKETDHHITDLQIALPFLSNLPYEVEIFTTPAFAAVVNGTPMSMHGESKPFYRTRQSEMNIVFRDIDLTDYLAYLPETLNFAIRQGRLNLDLSLSFMQHEDGNPAVNIRGQTSLHDMLVVDRQEKPLLLFPELAVDIERAHILRREFHLSRIFWREPRLFLQREDDGRFNLANLVARPAGNDQEEEPAASPIPLLLEVAETELDAAVIEFADRTVADTVLTTLEPVNLLVKNFSTLPDKTADYSLSFATESGEKAGVAGAFSFRPFTVAADVQVENVRLGKYRPYYESMVRAGLAADRAGAVARLDYTGADGALLISGLGLELGGLSITGPEGADRITIPDLTVAGTEVDLRNRTVSVDSLSSTGAVIPITMRRDGTINLEEFLVPAPQDKATPEAMPEEDNDDSQPGWQVVVRAVDFSKYEVAFSDQRPAEPVVLTLEQMRLAAENVSNRPGEESTVALDLLLNRSGRVKVNGTADLSRPALRLDIDLAELPLKSFQHYVQEKLDIIMTDGRGAVRGEVTLDRPEDGGFAVTFLGDVRSRGFSSLDAGQAEKLLSWNDVQVNALSVRTGPMRLSAGEILVDGLAAGVLKNREGMLNLSAIVREDAGRMKEEDEPAAEGRPPEVNIEVVRLADCRIEFSDRSVDPRFDTGLQKIDGSIKGFSSAADASAEIDITAELDRHSPVRLTGSIRPWQGFFTDITAEFSDIELSPVSPYSIKFIGYPLTKGKLRLDLHYLIDGRQLTAQNKAFIDQLTLGEHVENETAVDLPVQLAISLLKNRRGEIDLNLPVSGNLDDPEFSVAGVVFKMLSNLVLKAATSPFSLLGAVFTGGGEQQYIEFSPGKAEIGSEALEVLTEFARVLYDRPAIRVELTGQADPAADGEVLTRIRFERLLKVQKLKDTAGQEAAVSDVDAVEITADEYGRYLKKAYRAADFERPRNFFGMLKDIPDEEMEKLLYDNIVITADDLRKLAVDRAGAVRDVLMEKGPVEGERIFIVAPQGGYGESGGQAGIRVAISVK